MTSLFLVKQNASHFECLSRKMKLNVKITFESNLKTENALPSSWHTQAFPVTITTKIYLSKESVCMQTLVR